MASSAMGEGRHAQAAAGERRARMSPRCAPRPSELRHACADVVVSHGAPEEADATRP
jgi:hypothetical protein